MANKLAIPLYKSMFLDIKKHIDDGILKKGDFIPSENELCKLYNTTRPTVRQALAELTRLGYIIKQHGKGSMVSEPRNGLGILSLKGSTAGVGKKNLRTEILIKAAKVDWPDPFPFELSEEQKQAGCFYFTRLRHVNGEPTLYEETYITDRQLQRFPIHNLEKNSLFEILKKYYEVEVQEGEQQIWAVSADERTHGFLQLKIGDPVLHMKRKMKTNVEGLYIYSFLYCNTSTYHIQDYF